MKLATPMLLAGFVSLFWLACANEKEKPAPANPADSVRLDQSKDSVSNANPFAQVDISPMDMSYYPADYPKLKMTDSINTPPLARVIYSRPHLQGRKLFHDVLKYDEPWRMGANEATELQLFRDVTIKGKKIKAGRYVMYCIPNPDKWVIVLNTNIDSWGLKPDPSKDIARFEVPVNNTSYRLEYFTMAFEPSNNGATLVMAWDNVEARLPVNF